MRLVLAVGLALAMNSTGTAAAQTPAVTPQAAAPERVTITPAPESRDGSWPFRESQARTEPAKTPTAARPQPRAQQPAPAPAQAPAATAPRVTASQPGPAPVAPTRAVASPPRRAAAARVRAERVAARRARAARGTAERHARTAIGLAVAQPAAKTPADAGPPPPELEQAAVARPVSASAPATTSQPTDITLVVLAIPLLAGAAMLLCTRRGPTRAARRSRLRSRGRRDPQIAR